MIDGAIEFIGNKEGCEEWLEKFLKDFKKEKAIKGQALQDLCRNIRSG